MNTFTYLGKIEVPQLPDTLNWERYTFRQKTHQVHSQTKTIPLIWDQTLKGEVIYHPDYIYFKEFLEQLPFKNIISAILINLPAGKSIPRHIDTASFFKRHHRVHIPIVTNEKCLFTVGDEIRHLEQGEIWEIDNDNCYHSVINNGATDRIHLLIDYR